MSSPRGGHSDGAAPSGLGVSTRFRLGVAVVVGVLVGVGSGLLLSWH